jgi:hypothetical protein
MSTLTFFICLVDIYLVGSIFTLYIIYKRLNQLKDDKIDNLYNFNYLEFDRHEATLIILYPIFAFAMFIIIFVSKNEGIIVNGIIEFLKFKDYWFILFFILFISYIYVINIFYKYWNEFILRNSIFYMKENNNLIDYDKFYNLCKSAKISIFPIEEFKIIYSSAEKEDVFINKEKEIIQIETYKRLEEKIKSIIFFEKLNNTFKHGYSKNLIYVKI